MTNNITIYIQKYLQYYLIIYKIPVQYEQLHWSLVGVIICVQLLSTGSYDEHGHWSFISYLLYKVSKWNSQIIVNYFIGVLNIRNPAVFTLVVRAM